MSITRRVYVSLPADRWLPPNLNDLKWGIVEEIEKLGYTPEVFTNPQGKPGLASARAWSAGDADEVARRCCGAVVLGMQRWEFTDNGAPVLLPTEYNHYEGALFRTLRLPTLILVQKNVLRRVVFADTFAGYVGEFLPTDDEKWLRTNEFRVPFKYWKEALAERRDVFLGYSSRSKKAAATLKRFLQSKGVTVLDWLTDFIPGRTILEQIEQAATRSVGGIFLFTKDDLLADSGKAKLSVPRDNVVFEAGYFIGTKGKHNVLIIRQSGSKLPADLGGDIYVNLPKRAKITSVETEVETFISAL